ncbi:MAG: C40 family peptidase [Lachnospiraceae bacterium]|nr:C40 family peptidase [Lachnospiraceae bacterium]
MVIKSKFFRISSLCLVGAITIGFNRLFVSANTGIETVDGDSKEDKAIMKMVEEEKYIDTKSDEFSVNGLEESMKSQEEEDKKAEEEALRQEELAKEIPGIDYKEYIDFSSYSDLAVTNVTGYLNVRKTPSAEGSANIIAKMPPNAGCDILEETTNEAGEEWCKVKSGEVTGYVLSDYLVRGEDADKLARKVGRLVINVDCKVLKVRSEASIDSKTLYSINGGEQLPVLEVLDDWVKVEIEFSTGEEGEYRDYAYVSKEYISFSFELEKAIEVEELLTGFSAERTGIVSKAKTYLGNPYVYGGTSLTTGIDCSGFTMKLYAMYGYSLHRQAAQQAAYDGVAIKASELKPGDLVFYSNGSRVSHVAMFIGNGKIIHASNPRSGIKISNMNYSTPCKYKRIFKK